MQIQFPSLVAVDAVGVGEVIDLGVINLFDWSGVWLKLEQVTDHAGGNCHLEYSLNGTDWTVAGTAVVNQPIGLTNAVAIDGDQMPCDFGIAARYLRANLTTFVSTGTLTATIVING